VAGGIDGLQLVVPGQPFTVEPGQLITAEVFVMRPRENITSAETPLQFSLISGTDTLSSALAVFLGPIYRHDKDEHEE